MKLRKSTIVAAVLTAAFLAGCSMEEYEDKLDSASELVSDVTDVVDSANELMSKVSSAADKANKLASELSDLGLAESDTDDPESDAQDEDRKDADVQGTDEKDADKQDPEESDTDDSGSGKSESDNKDTDREVFDPEKFTGSILNDASDINLTDTDGKGRNYTFTYGDEVFRAEYTTPENWKIYNSYRINSETDLRIICQALIDEHPIHSKDMKNYRTADDMVYEWQIHNMVYAFLPDDDPFKDDCRDVDIDPKDQGLSIEEFYKSRTGKDFDLATILGG